MTVMCGRRPTFSRGSRVIVLTPHPPEVMAGDKAIIITPRVGRLYAVRLADGKPHTWLARAELKPLKDRPLRPGDKAKILNSEGHPPSVRKGEVVTILRVVYTPYYDAYIKGMYHRWFADFELASAKY